jgi:hypothetical protein
MVLLDLDLRRFSIQPVDHIVTDDASSGGASARDLQLWTTGCIGGLTMPELS